MTIENKPVNHPWDFIKYWSQLTEEMSDDRAPMPIAMEWLGIKLDLHRTPASKIERLEEIMASCIYAQEGGFSELISASESLVTQLRFACEMQRERIKESLPVSVA